MNQIYHLAALPIGYLTRQDDLLECMRTYGRAFTPYREVFITATQAYQQYAYLELVRRIYGHALVGQVEVQQHRLFDLVRGTGSRIKQALDLVEKALGTDAVSVPTWLGDVDVPIEMNVALAVLLGLPESPDYVNSAAARVEQIARMPPEVDWRLANSLARARGEMVRTFSPVLTCFEGIATKRRCISHPG
jgi:hypothetical protein